MKQTLLLFWLLSSLVAVPLSGQAQEGGNCTLEMSIVNTVGPATRDLVHRSIEQARSQSCQSILMLINTPGGSLPATRLIVEDILNSPVPFLCLIYPSGAHAGSAGAIIHQACHVNGALPATNLGAATPILAGGQEVPEDLRKKMLNDSRSWLEGITQMRGRSEKFGQDIILEAKAVSADEALRLKAIDWVGEEKADFLKFASGRSVKMSQNQTVEVKVGNLLAMPLDYRYQALSFFTDPETAYLMFMGSLALLYFELTHPGIGAAGVIGGIGLIVSLVAMHKLEVEWAGLLLILLGIVLLIAEVFITSFGILGIGGITALVFGSVFLYDPSKTGGYSLPLSLILPIAILLGGVMLGVGYLALRTHRLRKHGAADDLTGAKARVISLDEGSDGRRGQVELNGEIWRFESDVKLEMKAQVVVKSYQGLLLKVADQKEV